ncbi:hypothetical protein [Pontimicrobium sp. MEBiC06410]|jgi:hypothetical protein
MKSKLVIKREDNSNNSIISLMKDLRSINYFNSSEEANVFFQKYSEDEKVEINLNESNQETIIEFLNELNFIYN